MVDQARRFRFGVAAHAVASAQRWRALARQTEDLGYATLLLPDHANPQLAPIPGLLAAALCTTTLRVGTQVLDNDNRNPVIAAKEVASIDLLTDGRFDWGMGAGWLTSDYEATGIAFEPPKVRLERLMEAVTVMRSLFAGGPVDFDGEHYTVRGAVGDPRPVRVVAPAGTVVAASFPAAVGAGNVEVSQRVADVCLGALAQVLPHRVPAASQGTMNNLLIGGDGWVSYETIAGGQGGRPPRTAGAAPVPGQSGIHTNMTNTDQIDPRLAAGVPGQSGIHTAMTNTRNTPIEALERAFPLRVLRQRLRRGSGGAGSAPGGEGIERDLQVLVDATVSLITERRVSQPWGLAGGEPGAVGENWLLPGGNESRAERLPDKCTIQLKAGDVLRMLTPGGGGWGRRRQL